MSRPALVSAQQARDKSLSGEARLVCAYDDDSKCRSVMLEGSISWTSLLEELPNLNLDQEIILYCA